ncbi:hypothetical protein FHS43_002007 [Streptosporangium becharense]|uniref:Uncharacterized protein n=1 Tax=Streptosporangium becharense TaxID=1816182 RepID=A0A7W9MEK9_9ACTN|nr:hypothetical protein [Streptosporangium becharense]MBB2910744.1 hypothetical protein [Streptosporangium becharense]MBB5817439.1 hypothetical protein [Streptosporangium becharense]
MNGSSRRSALQVSRWLLIALILGIAGMHTLGHLSHERGHGGLAAVSGHASPDDHKIPEARPVSAPVPETGIEHLLPLPGDPLPVLDPTSVCLAVLASLLLLFLGVWSAWTRQVQDARAADASPVLLVARPPPRRTALRLASLSVLRI